MAHRFFSKSSYMSVVILPRLSRTQKKVWYSLEWGKGPGQRIATGIFTFAKPKDVIERNHNKEALATLKTRQSQMILDFQAIGTGYIPQHRIKSNFLDYYAEYVEKNRRKGNRHLSNSFDQFKAFIGKGFLSPLEITENLCENFRAYLLERFNGETPANYFYKFKKVLKAAKASGYFRENPAEMITAKTKPNKIKKQVLEVEDYLKLVKTPCLYFEVKRAFVFCMYHGLRWCDIKTLKWEHIRPTTIALQQKKTDVLVEIPLHPIGQQILGARGRGQIFRLTSHDRARKCLKKWCEDAGVDKHITWHCARLSFSVLLQDENVDKATVAGMLGHTSTKYVEEVYQRYRPHIGRKAIEKLPVTKF